MAMHSRVRSPLSYGLMALALSAPTIARGAGLEAPENGAYVLARGGTGVALTGTAYSLQFNPAGLADVEGWDIRLDARFVGSGISFQRDSRENGGSGIPLTFDKVSNSAGVFVAPGLYVAYKPTQETWRKFSFGVGVFGPPGIGKYQYPDPRTLPHQTPGADDYDPTLRVTAAPQRYSLISNSNTILYPSVGVSFTPIKQLSIGLTAQAAIASISFAQALAGASISGQEIGDTDGIANLAVKDSFTPTFIAGVMVKPIDNLVIGAMFRPQVALDAKGTLKVDFAPGSAAKQAGEDASLKLHLAPQARLGASYDFGRFSLAAEGVWEGWHVNKKMILDASAVTIQTKPNEAYKPVGTKLVERNWKDTWGGRLGGTWKAIQPTPSKKFGLQVHAGALFETNAIPSENQGIDTVTGDRIGGSAGVTASYGPWGVTLGAMVYKPVTLHNTDSMGKRSVSDPNDQDDPPIYVSRGTYDASLWIASLGLAYSPSFMK
jgi:long-subunit fatty acid transport protein